MTPRFILNIPCVFGSLINHYSFLLIFLIKATFNEPIYDCFTTDKTPCKELLGAFGAWERGVSEMCLRQDLGIRIGPQGYTGMLVQVGVGLDNFILNLLLLLLLLLLTLLMRMLLLLLLLLLRLLHAVTAAAAAAAIITCIIIIIIINYTVPLE